MIKTLSITFMTGTLLTIAPSYLLADSSQCPTWQTNPTSVAVSSLTSTSLTDVKNCMSTCNSNALSSSNSDLTPALCMQNVSYIEYLTEFANNTANPNSTITPSQASSSLQSSAPPLQSTMQTTAPPEATSSQSSSQTIPSSPPPSNNTKKPKKNSQLINWL